MGLRFLSRETSMRYPCLYRLTLVSKPRPYRFSLGVITIRPSGNVPGLKEEPCVKRTENTKHFNSFFFVMSSVPVQQL